MTWTALVAEYFVIGCHTIIWLLLLSLASGLAEVDKLKDALAKQPDTVTAALGVGLAVATYSLGILFDTVWFNVSLKLLKPRTRRLWKRYAMGPDKESIGWSFYAAEDRFTGPEGWRERMFRRRSRLRVFRSLMFNLPLITLAACLAKFSWLLLFSGVLLEALTVTAFLSVHDQYVRMLARHGGTLAS